MKTAIQSVINQSYGSWELLVIDDASGYIKCRNKAEYIDSLNDKRVSFTTLAMNRGHAAVRNVGLSIATGDWVKYLDDDDELYPNCLQRLAEVVAEHDPLVVTAKYHSIHNDEVRVLGDDFNKVDVFKSCKLDTCCIAHARSCLTTGGGWNQRLARFADGDFIIRYTRMFADRYVHVDDVLSNFIIRDNLRRASNSSGNFNALSAVYARYNLGARYGRLLVLADREHAFELVNMHNFVSSDFMSTDVFTVDRNHQVAVSDIIDNYNYVATYSGTSTIDAGLESVRFGRQDVFNDVDIFSPTTPLCLARVAKKLLLFAKA